MKALAGVYAPGVGEQRLTLDKRFDGDFMQVWLVPDRKTLRRLANLEPSRSVLDVARPRSLSNSFKQQSPQVLTMYNYLYGEQLKSVQEQARKEDK